MRGIDDLRRELDLATADLVSPLSPERVRRRARVVRMRRGAAAGSVAVLATVALAVPAVVLSRGGLGGPVDSPVGQSSTPADPTPVPENTQKFPDPPALGQVVGTGVTVDGPDQTSLEVVLYLTGTRDRPNITYGFRDPGTGVIRPSSVYVWDRAPNGELSGKHPEDPTIEFVSCQLVLGPHRVLDLGLYAGRASRISVASEGHATDADTAANAETGWTLFWVERDAAPLPEDALAGPDEYLGPERLTITAYSGARPVADVTGGFHIGHTLQVPSDNPSNEEPPGVGSPSEEPPSVSAP
jgi:hypothetical protein